MLSNRDKIKNKVLELDDKKWRADPFDVRYFLISKLKNYNSKTILDVGGGIGIIESEMNQSNFRVNIDTSIIDLKTCLKKNDPKINPICASMLNLPFKDDFFDIVISSHVIELAKLMDLSNQKEEKKEKFLNMKKVMTEKYRVLKKNGKLFLTTPNYSYHKTKNKLTYCELKSLLNMFFKNFSINFFNTLPKLSTKTKFNFANIVPKIKVKLGNDPDQIINSLIKKNSKNNYSVYFYVEAIKN